MRYLARLTECGSALERVVLAMFVLLAAKGPNILALEVSDNTHAAARIIALGRSQSMHMRLALFIAFRHISSSLIPSLDQLP